MNQSKRTKTNVRNSQPQKLKKVVKQSIQRNQRKITSQVTNKVAIAGKNILRRVTDIVRSPAPYHPIFGTGIRVTGRQYLTSVITSAIDNQLFSGNSPANANTIYISPDAFNGRLALEARTFERYLFRKLRLIYTPRVATTQAGEFAVAYFADGQAASFFTYSFTNIQDNETAYVSSFHNGGEQLVMEFKVPQGAENSYYCELDSATIAGLRQSVQGTILGYPDVTSIGATTMGNLSVEYEVDFYCPASDLGFSLSRIKDKDEADYLRKQQMEFRKSHESHCIDRTVDDNYHLSQSTNSLLTTVLKRMV